MAADRAEVLAQACLENFIMGGKEFGNPNTNSKIWLEMMHRLACTYYKMWADLLHIQEEKLNTQHFEKIIAAFKAKSLSDDMRNRILGGILAADILRAKALNSFLEGDAWLSKQLIAALINPKGLNFTADVIAIFKIALCHPTVVAKFKKLQGDGDLKALPCLEQIFLDEAVPNKGVISTVVTKHIASEEKRDFSQSRELWYTVSCSYEESEDFSQSANLCLTAFCHVGAVLLGSLLILLGFLLMLSTVATAIVSFGLSVPVSLGVGAGMMVTGAGMIAAWAKKCGFFSSPRKEMPCAGETPQNEYSAPTQ